MRRLFRTTRALWMRFDKENPPNESPTNDAKDSAPPVRFTPLTETMKPKAVSLDFTPFPLPKYDTALGFGPVRLTNIPDIEKTRERMRQPPAPRPNPPRTLVEVAPPVEEGFLQPADLFDDGLAAPRRPIPSAPDAGLDLQGYEVAPRFPAVDRLECRRSVGDLLAQFANRPQREARTATVWDFASSLPRRSNADLTRMFYELGGLFTPHGRGLQFPMIKVVKYGRPYFVSSSLLQAFWGLLEAATETFTLEQPERLCQSPPLFLQLLHFLALVKVFEPNLWFSPNPTMIQNRADYSHPRGVNRSVSHQRTGEDLFDYMMSLLLMVDEPQLPNNDRGSSFLDRFSFEQLLDLLGGLAAVMPDGRPEGKVVNAILQNLIKRWENQHNEVRSLDEVRNLERLYLILNLMNIKCNGILCALLEGGGENEEEKLMKSLGRCAFPAISLRLHPSLGQTNSDAVRGPDFFASVSREKSAEVLRRAVVELRRSLLFAHKTQNKALLLSLAESGMELLMVLPDKDEAVRVARAEGLDHLLLENIPGLEIVKERIQLEEGERIPDVVENLHDLQPFLSKADLEYSPRYLTQYQGKFVHPIRTLLSDLIFVNSIDNVLLLHSSIVEKSVSPLISTIHQRGRSGKDLLLITTSCLRALEVELRYSEGEKRHNFYKRALEAIGYELEQGRAILVPFTEELLLHDARTYCDEDLILWTLAAFFARELPLVKVLTLISRTSLASRPYHYLKGEHSPLSAGEEDLYRQNVPLLQALRSKELRAVTRSAVVQAPVRDRPTAMFYRVNPSRRRFLYRRDKALFDKYHVVARNISPGFSQGALASDLRGLGFYTPDHPQVPYTPLPRILQKHLSA
ncbi:unnamed protein product [Phytomonas sp. Hart1]|nr:unnamed protein product [Phytomonas sp. Hart1]|eukprot:CCW71088.1 unnamed protein product [Phytomonas sp. isolate Hart1]